MVKKKLQRIKIKNALSPQRGAKETTINDMIREKESSRDEVKKVSSASRTSGP
jgi:hypothetical protein